MARKVLALLLFLVAVAVSAQRAQNLAIPKKPFALNVPDSLLVIPSIPKLENFRWIDSLKENAITEAQPNMPIFKPNAYHTTPISPVDSTQIFYLRVFPPSK